MFESFTLHEIQKIGAQTHNDSIEPKFTSQCLLSSASQLSELAEISAGDIMSKSASDSHLLPEASRRWHGCALANHHAILNAKQSSLSQPTASI